MKALITGATGFIGSNVARELLHQGFEVRALAFPGPSTCAISFTGFISRSWRWLAVEFS